jgi:predicted nucleotide-binding protein
LDIGHRGLQPPGWLTLAVLNVAEGLAEVTGVASQARDWLRRYRPGLPTPRTMRVEIQSRDTGMVVSVSADDPDEALRLLDGALRSAGPASLSWDGTAWRPDEEPEAESVVSAPGHAERERTVFVVHGRDKRVRRGLFDFLRTLGLHPIEWAEALAQTGHGSPYVGDILDVIMDRGQAVVVLLTPDEVSYLRAEHADDDRDPAIKPAGQARPNVLFEAGMAMARFPERTILVRMGDVRTFTDLEGRHFVQLDNTPEKRNLLAEKLRTVGCKVNTIGKDWLSGDLTPPAPIDDRPSNPTSGAQQVPAPGRTSLNNDDSSPGLDLTGCVVVTGPTGDLTVHGEATNRTGQELTAILSATFYGEGRTIIGTAAGALNQIRPGATKTFSLVTMDDLTGYLDFVVQLDTVF